jgi:hypothetical protein
MMPTNSLDQDRSWQFDTTAGKKACMALIGVLLVLASGCWTIGICTGAGRTITLTFRSPAAQSETSLSSNRPELQEALKVIDDVLIPEGITRVSPDALAPQKKYGWVASTNGWVNTNGWGVVDTNGWIGYSFSDRPFTLAYCEVAVREGRVEIRFFETHYHHSSPQVKRVCVLLAKELRNHFGDKRVKVKIRSWTSGYI